MLLRSAKYRRNPFQNKSLRHFDSDQIPMDTWPEKFRSYNWIKLCRGGRKFEHSPWQTPNSQAALEFKYPEVGISDSAIVWQELPSQLTKGSFDFILATIRHSMHRLPTQIRIRENLAPCSKIFILKNKLKFQFKKLLATYSLVCHLQFQESLFFSYPYFVVLIWRSRTSLFLLAISISLVIYTFSS